MAVAGIKTNNYGASEWYGQKSTWPAWAENKGYTKKRVLHAIDKHIKDPHSLAPGQAYTLSDLVESSRDEYEGYAASREKAANDARPASENQADDEAYWEAVLKTADVDSGQESAVISG